MHDDYGKEPSWPVALVVGAIALVVGIVVRVRNCLRWPRDRTRRLLGRTDDAEQDQPDPLS